MPELPREKRYWLFQSSPSVYDLLADLAQWDIGELSQWNVTAHRDKMAAGDDVAFWVAGKNGGLAAFGSLVSDVYEDEAFSNPDEQGYWVDWQLTHIVDPPVPRPVLTAHPKLSRMPPIAQPHTGTNFKVTPEQWQALLQVADADYVPSDRYFRPDEETEGEYSVALERLSEATFMSPEKLQELESLIHSKKQIIFEGPPGSGKTYVARLFARYLAGLPLDGDPDPHVEIVQFHQSYGYEDFVAGIRPVTSEGGTLTYETRPGIFVEMCRRAMAQPDETFVLIIDEINRGNLSRIFGELLYGLEYRDQPVRMQYPVTIDGVEREHLTIPDNLYVIGTMNSTDRSLAMIDYALRRRFYFWRLMPMEGNDAPVLRHWLDRQEEIDPADRQRLLDAFIALNGSIVQLLGEDYQIGHSYFMLNDGMAGDPAAIARVWQHAIEPLLREYFHTRHDSGAHIAKMRSHFVAPPVASLPEFDMDVLDS